jgi:hypothetical protein
VVHAASSGLNRSCGTPWSAAHFWARDWYSLRGRVGPVWASRARFREVYPLSAPRDSAKSARDTNPHRQKHD